MKIRDRELQSIRPADQSRLTAGLSTTAAAKLSPRRLLSIAAFFAAALAPAAAGAEEVAEFSMSIDEFRALSPADQKALLISAFEHRLQHAQNIHYEALELLSNADYDPATGKVGEVTQRLNGSRLRHWVRGRSFRMDTIRGGPDVSEALQTVAFGLDAKSGVARSTVHFKSGRRPSGRIGTELDRINESNFYAYWLDGKHTGHNDFLPRYLVEHQAEFAIAAPRDENTVRLAVPWYYASMKRPWGTRTFDLDPQKGFLPIRGKARWELNQDGITHWRVDEFWVEESRLVGDVWMPTKLRWLIGASSGNPRLCSVHNITVSQIEAGGVRDEDLEVPFEPGMLIVDAIQGVAYTVGSNIERTHVEPLVGAAGLPPATDGPTGISRLLVFINLGVLLATVTVYIWRRGRRGRREDPIRSTPSNA